MKPADVIQQIPVNLPRIGLWRRQGRNQLPHVVGANVRGFQAVEEVYDPGPACFEFFQAFQQEAELGPEHIGSGMTPAGARRHRRFGVDSGTRLTRHCKPPLSKQRPAPKTIFTILACIFRYYNTRVRGSANPARSISSRPLADRAAPGDR